MYAHFSIHTNTNLKYFQSIFFSNTPILIITGEEFLYQDHWGRIVLLNASSLNERVLMSNVTYVSTKVRKS